MNSNTPKQLYNTLNKKIYFYILSITLLVLILSFTINVYANNEKADLNGDSKIDVTDLNIASERYNSTNAEANLNSDGIVNIFDLVMISTSFGSVRNTFDEINFVNTQFYILSGNSNAPTRTNISGSNNGYIAPGDLCKIIEQTNDTYWKVEYPTSNGSKQAYLETKYILNDYDYARNSTQQINIPYDLTVYKKADMASQFGSVWTSDTIYQVSPEYSSERTQVHYNVIGGYKLGWVYKPSSTLAEYIWPVPSVYSITGVDVYNQSQNRHSTSNSAYSNAIDISATQDTTVVSIADGVVLYAGNTGDWKGNHVKIRHSDNTVSWYCHLYACYVSTGDVVTKGMRIAGVGNTGNSSGNHLHFEYFNENGVGEQLFRYYLTVSEYYPHITYAEYMLRDYSFYY